MENCTFLNSQGRHLHAPFIRVDRSRQSTDGHGALCQMSSCTNRPTNRHFCPQTGRQKGTVDGGGDETRTPGDDACSLQSPEVGREREITTENHRAEGRAMECLQSRVPTTARGQQGRRGTDAQEESATARGRLTGAAGAEPPPRGPQEPLSSAFRVEGRSSALRDN